MKKLLFGVIIFISVLIFSAVLLAPNSYASAVHETMNYTFNYDWNGTTRNNNWYFGAYPEGTATRTNEIAEFDSGTVRIELSNRAGEPDSYSFSLQSPGIEDMVISRQTVSPGQTRTFDVDFPERCHAFAFQINTGEYDRFNATIKVYHLKNGSSKLLSYTRYPLSVNVSPVSLSNPQVDTYDISFKADEYPLKLLNTCFSIRAYNGVSTRTVSTDNSNIIESGNGWFKVRDTMAQPGQLYNYSYGYSKGWMPRFGVIGYSMETFNQPISIPQNDRVVIPMLARISSGSLQLSVFKVIKDVSFSEIVYGAMDGEYNNNGSWVKAVSTAESATGISFSEISGVFKSSGSKPVVIGGNLLLFKVIEPPTFSDAATVTFN